MKPARRTKAPSWTSQEIAVLCEFYPEGGIEITSDMLPERSRGSICTMASKLRLRSPIEGHARMPELAGEQLEQAIRLREVEKWSFSRIGAKFGVCETSASNAVIMALCPRKGFTPVPRSETGRILPEGIERIRSMLSAGRKAVDIQLECGVSAACVAKQRRDYASERKKAGARPLPPPGGGIAYSGAKVGAAKRADVEALFLEGFGAFKIGERTAVSHTTILRIRSKLIKRLARRGETLPGCDFNGRRRRQKDSAHHIPADAIEQFRRRLLDREPVSIAAEALGIGASSAYRIRDELAADLRARGETLPPPKRLARTAARERAREVAWLPSDQLVRRRFRRMARQLGQDEAKRALLAEIAADRQAKAEAQRRERSRPKTFEEQLEMVRRGAGIIQRVAICRPSPSYTLGGVASGAL